MYIFVNVIFFLVRHNLHIDFDCTLVGGKIIFIIRSRNVCGLLSSILLFLTIVSARYLICEQKLALVYMLLLSSDTSTIHTQCIVKTLTYKAFRTKKISMGCIRVLNREKISTYSNIKSTEHKTSHTSLCSTKHN